MVMQNLVQTEDAQEEDLADIDEKIYNWIHKFKKNAWRLNTRILYL